MPSHSRLAPLWRANGSRSLVGAVLLEIDPTAVGNESLNTVPSRGYIRRVRVDVTAGTAINTIQFELRQSTGGTGFDVVASQALAAEPLDVLYDPPRFYSVTETASGQGRLFMAVAVDNAALDHTVQVRLDIENAG